MNDYRQTIRDPAWMQQLTAASHALGLGLSLQQLEALQRYWLLLTEWNQAYNLVSLEDPMHDLVVHLADSLSVASALRGSRIVDVGSGGGLPGIPLAIALPDRRITLIESIGKKNRFLRQARLELRLDNVELQETRAEDYHPSQGFDTVLCRALGSLKEFIELAGHLPTEQGILLAQKGRYPAEELSDLSPPWRASEVRELYVPGLNQERHLVVLSASEK